MRYSTDSCISPEGGTVNPATPNATAAKKEATATTVWIFAFVFIIYNEH